MEKCRARLAKEEDAMAKLAKGVLPYEMEDLHSA